MLVAVRQNMCGVPVWTWCRHISIIEGRWRKFGGLKQWNVETVCIYERQFERFSGAYSFANTQGMLVVVRQNACGVPVWTWFRHISIIAAFCGSWEHKGGSKLFVTLVTEVSLISRESNLRFERISISREILWKIVQFFSLLHLLGNTGKILN